jgi:hypothetical protein
MNDQGQEPSWSANICQELGQWWQNATKNGPFVRKNTHAFAEGAIHWIDVIDFWFLLYC